MVSIKKINENYVHLECSRDVALEIFEAFSFYPEGYRFTPAFKFGTWDRTTSSF